MSSDNSVLFARVASLAEAAELKQIVDSFRERSFRYLIIKGAATCHSHYASPHLRPHIDIDIWIDPSQRSAIEACLVRRGYSLESDATPAHLQRQFAMRRSLTPELEIALDLHLKISNARPFENLLVFNDAFRRAKELVLDGLRFSTLCDVDALILASIHPVMHHHSGLHHHLYQDVGVLFLKMGLDERRAFYQRAKTLGISTLCRQSFKNSSIETSPDDPDCWSKGLTRERFELLSIYPYFANGFWGQFFADILFSPPTLQQWRTVFRAAFPRPSYMLERQNALSSRWSFIKLPWLYGLRLVRGLFAKR